jgi:hypothetical protein
MSRVTIPFWLTLSQKIEKKEMPDAETYLVLRSLCPIGTSIDWFCPAAQLTGTHDSYKIGTARRYAMLKCTWFYARYALSALASIGFALTDN